MNCKSQERDQFDCSAKERSSSMQTYEVPDVLADALDALVFEKLAPPAKLAQAHRRRTVRGRRSECRGLGRKDGREKRLPEGEGCEGGV